MLQCLALFCNEAVKMVTEKKLLLSTSTEKWYGRPERNLNYYVYDKSNNDYNALPVCQPLATSQRNDIVHLEALKQSVIYVFLAREKVVQSRLGLLSPNPRKRQMLCTL